MIVVDVNRLREQVAMTPNLKKAVAFLLRQDLLDLPDGQVVIDERRVYSEVQSYETADKDEVTFEGHRAYIDIQYVAAGEETIAWASIDDVSFTSEYNAEHDYWLGTVNPENVTDVRLRAGQLAVLYPSDAHAPRRVNGRPSHVKKFVVKVAVDG